jgi:hypothetical protein
MQDATCQTGLDALDLNDYQTPGAVSMAIQQTRMKQRHLMVIRQVLQVYISHMAPCGAQPPLKAPGG